MTDFTVYTPTYNRAHTLVRVYDCLKNQSYKDFIWLIIDDGSTDNTKELVDIWINEAKIKIRYLYKPNGGKHTAMELAHRSVSTKYVIGLDSDDILLPNAIEIFQNQWKQIEDQGLDDEIAELRGFLSRKLDEKIIGGDFSIFKEGINYIDSNWHEWVLKKKCFHEMLSSFNTYKLNECVSISKYKYKIDNIKFISEGIFWSSIGRKYRTRYIRQIVGIVFYDSEGSLLRPKVKDKNRFYNHMVGSFYMVDENIQYFWYNPSYFIKSIFLFSISGFYLGETFRNQFKEITNKYFSFLFLILYPLSYITYLYYKYIMKLK